MNMKKPAAWAFLVVSLLTALVFPANTSETGTAKSLVVLVWSLRFDETIRLEDTSDDASLLVALSVRAKQGPLPSFLYAVDKDARLLWKKRAETGEWDAAKVSPDGRFVCGIMGETLIPSSDAVKYTSFLFDASGEELWRKDGAEVQEVPTFSPDSTYMVYQPDATGAGPVHLVNVEGTVVARVDVEVAYLSLIHI